MMCPIGQSVRAACASLRHDQNGDIVPSCSKRVDPELLKAHSSTPQGDDRPVVNRMAAPSTHTSAADRPQRLLTLSSQTHWWALRHSRAVCLHSHLQESALQARMCARRQANHLWQGEQQTRNQAVICYERVQHRQSCGGLHDERGRSGRMLQLDEPQRPSTPNKSTRTVSVAAPVLPSQPTVSRE